MILLKTIVYRTYSLLILFSIALLFTGDPSSSLYGSLGIEGIKVIQYYIFEKLWH